MTSRRPDWDVDRALGEEAEELYRRMRTAVLIGEAEVKRDFRVGSTGNFYLEYECRTAGGWRPSGIATTRAATWVFVAWPLVIAIPTSVMRGLARDAWRDPARRKEQTRGSHPTRGVTIPAESLLRDALVWVNRPAHLEDAA